MYLLTRDVQICYVSRKLIGQTDLCLLSVCYFSGWSPIFANIKARWSSGQFVGHSDRALSLTIVMLNREKHSNPITVRCKL